MSRARPNTRLRDRHGGAGPAARKRPRGKATGSGRAHRWPAAAEAGSVDAQVRRPPPTTSAAGADKIRPAEAARWYREAAKGGDVGAQYLLASMYEQGDGVERDLRLARYWYDAAPEERRRGRARQGAEDRRPLRARPITARREPRATAPP
jgi:hypothetical protein